MTKTYISLICAIVFGLTLLMALFMVITSLTTLNASGAFVWTLADALQGKPVGLNTARLQEATNIEDGAVAVWTLYTDTMYERLSGNSGILINEELQTNVNNLWYVLGKWFGGLKNAIGIGE